MRRRALLASLAAGVGTASGCLSHDSDSSTESPTSRVDVPPCPGKPSPLSEAGAESFTAKFEQAYVARQVVSEQRRVTSFEFLDHPTPTVVAQEADGFRLHFEAYYAYGYRQHSTVEDTATYDSGYYKASYYVDPERTFRATDHESYPPPREDGEAVRCG